MSPTVRDQLEDVIAALHREAATALAWADEIARTYPWRRHDERIYKTRAETALLAVKHLEREVMPLPS